MRRLLAWLYICLFAGFFIIGLLGLAFGLLDNFDNWLDAKAGAFDAAGSRLLNVLWGGVLALCAYTVLGGLWQRFMAPRGEMGDAADFVAETAEADELDPEAKRPPGWGCMFVALIVGYFAWFGMTG